MSYRRFDIWTYCLSFDVEILVSVNYSNGFPVGANPVKVTLVSTNKIAGFFTCTWSIVDDKVNQPGQAPVTPQTALVEFSLQQAGPFKASDCFHPKQSSSIPRHYQISRDFYVRSTAHAQPGDLISVTCLFNEGSQHSHKFPLLFKM